ncbi:MAG: hypothetical protein AB7I59_01035 [Geminicoccaceae bacterium]
MRNLMAILGGGVLLCGCIPAKIVASDGPQVTYSWNSNETSLQRVYELAISYCEYWNAPPRLIGDAIEGDEHRSTFRCVPRETLPFGKTPVGKLLNRI